MRTQTQLDPSRSHVPVAPEGHARSTTESQPTSAAELEFVEAIARWSMRRPRQHPLAVQNLNLRSEPKDLLP